MSIDVLEWHDLSPVSLESSTEFRLCIHRCLRNSANVVLRFCCNRFHTIDLVFSCWHKKSKYLFPPKLQKWRCKCIKAPLYAPGHYIHLYIHKCIRSIVVSGCATHFLKRFCVPSCLICVHNKTLYLNDNALTFIGRGFIGPPPTVGPMIEYTPFICNDSETSFGWICIVSG
jgi:hypothetical protein